MRGPRQNQPAPARQQVPSPRCGAVLVIAMVGLLWLQPTSAADLKEPKPVWEIGAAGGAGWIPDYPASDEHHLVGLVLPYVIYRGKIFRAGDEGIVRGRFLQSDHHEFDISLKGSFPADSSNNEARQGMPDLDLLVEIGPRLKLTLVPFTPQAKLGLELPVRMVVSVALDEIAYRGLTFHPRLTYTHRELFASSFSLKVSGGPIFATERLMDYFYEVDAPFVTPRRAAFDADPGYLGTEFSFLLHKKVTPRIGLYGAFQVGYYEGATNSNSPLFRSKTTVSMGLGFTWSIYRSKRHVIE